MSCAEVVVKTLSHPLMKTLKNHFSIWQAYNGRNEHVSSYCCRKYNLATYSYLVTYLKYGVH